MTSKNIVSPRRNSKLDKSKLKQTRQKGPIDLFFILDHELVVKEKKK